MKRILYLGYYLKEMDWEELRKFLSYVHTETGMSKWSIIREMIWSSLKYNISLLEYFLFKFYEIPKSQRATFAGTGYMYEYQLTMNPKASREVLKDKLQFLKIYADFVHHEHASLEELKQNPAKAERILNNSTGKVVLKNSDGQCGNGVEVRQCSDFDAQSLIARMEETGNNLAEEFVQQHRDLHALSPSGLNTVRFITQLNNKGEVEFLGAPLRISVNSSVDNMAAGNLVAPVNIETGKVSGPAVYSDITKPDAVSHPVTGMQIVGFEIPFWQESLDLVKKAHLHGPANKSIGWDVAITDAGPELIEGNHNWCKLVWQLPEKKGLKPLLSPHYKN